MKRLGWRNIVFGCKNQIMIAVTKRLESGQIKSRVGAFPDGLCLRLYSTPTQPGMPQ